MNKDQNIKWYEVNNLVPIVFTLITTVVTVVGFWFSLSNKIDLLNQKVDYLVQTQKEYFDRNREVQIRVGELQVKVKELETILSNR